MLSRKGMAEAMYAMDILASKLDAGTRLPDWEKETGFGGPSETQRPTDAQIAFYEGWLAAKTDADAAFQNVVSSFVFLLCREAFGRIGALDDLVCAEDVFS